MKKKIALLLTSLLILTALLTTPYFTPPATSQPKVYHWKVVLAQKYCNARIVGNLTKDDAYLEGTDFNLTCRCGAPDPQPLGQFVFWKVATNEIPTDIHYVNYTDWNKDGTWEDVGLVKGVLTPPTPEEPHTWYQHVEYGAIEEQMVVVEVHEQPYEADRPFFEWQLTIRVHGCDARWTGNLTKDGNYLSGTDFNITCKQNMQNMSCQVVRTEWCTVPNDIDSQLLFIGMPSPVGIKENITQFPWTKTVPSPGEAYVELELTEVQMYHYIVVGGLGPNCAQLGTNAPMYWNIPFSTRPPDFTPLQEQSFNMTFTQKDPITGIVKTSVPAESYVGINHVFDNTTAGLWFNVTTFLLEQGCGYIFTGQGKSPVSGDVNIITWNNDTGIYSNRTGELIKLQPCLQGLLGPDGIPGTYDSGDIFGDGTPDPPGSSVLYLNTIVHAEYNTTGPPSKPEWFLLYKAPYPQVYTTAAANDTVVEPDSAFNGIKASAKGQPWEFLAGQDTWDPDRPPEQKGPVPWKHPKCNAYVNYSCAWSVLLTSTALGWLDNVFYITEKVVREDCLLPDIKAADEEIKIFDVRRAAAAYDKYDEGIHIIEEEEVWIQYADAGYDAAADVKEPKGYIGIFDVRRIAGDYGYKLTPICKVKE